MSQRKAMASTAIVVLGMHRSGTSALTACLQALGATLGGDLVPANHDNPGGYFENAAAVTAHDTLLAELDRGWEDLRDLPAGWEQSESARSAGTRVRQLVREEFPDSSLWALKDPRLCRLLPLWRSPLADAGVGLRCVVMLRHPDEVVASLVKRDGMAAEHGYLLWLRYFLDAVRDSAGTTRCLLDYDALLDAPAGAMRGVGEALGVAWPTPLDDVAFDTILDAGKRHHRPSSDTPEADSARAQAIALYREARAADTPWPEGDAARAYLDRRVADMGAWLDDTGNALARVRREAIGLRGDCLRIEQGLRRADALSRERLDQLHALQARVEKTDQALQATAAQSMARLGELGTLHARIASTDAALDDAKALSVSRLAELAELNDRLAATDAELAKAQSIALDRLGEIEAQRSRIANTDEALAEARSLSVERLEVIDALRGQVVATEAGLSEATALSLARLEALVATEAGLAQATALSMARLEEIAATEAGLAQATALSLARLDEIVALHARLKATDAALGVADDLATRRMQTVHEMQARLDATDAALDHAALLARERLADVEALDARLRDADAALRATEALCAERAEALAHANRLLDERDAALATLRGSRSWRFTRPLRWLESLAERMRGRR